MPQALAICSDLGHARHLRALHEHDHQLAQTKSPARGRAFCVNELKYWSWPYDD